MAGLYWLQNVAGVLGGAVAPAKALWLSLALIFWFVMPALMAADARLNSHERRLFGLFFVFMLVRGVIELWMLYISNNWHPYYGITHNLICLLLLGGLLIRSCSTYRLGVRLLSLVLISMLIAETYFAWYFLNAFATAGTEIFFVPDDPAFAVVLRVTWIMVIFVGASATCLSMRWPKNAL